MLSMAAVALCNALIYESQYGPLSHIEGGTYGTCKDGVCVVYWTKYDECTEDSPYRIPRTRPKYELPHCDAPDFGPKPDPEERECTWYGDY